MRRLVTFLALFVMLVPLLLLTAEAVLADAGVAVGVSSTATTGQLPNEVKSWWANGYYWAAYVGDDGAANEYLVARSSADGRVGWSAPTTLRASGVSTSTGIAVDGNNAHVAGASTYRLWACSALGAIAPLAAEQDLNAISGISANGDTIAVDNANHAFIGYRETTTNLPYVIDNTATDGTWTTGTNQALSAVADASWRVTVVHLTGGDMYVVYARAGQPVLGRRYTAGAWGIEETVSTSNIEQGDFVSVTTLDGDVHVAFVTTNAPPRALLVVSRTYATGAWGAEATVNNNVGYTAPFLTSDEDTDTLRLFLMDAPAADAISYYKYVRGAWDAAPTTWFTDGAGIADTIHGNAWAKTQNDSYFVTYKQTGGAPFNYVVNQLNEPTVTAQAETVLSMTRDGVTSGTFNYNLTGLGLSPSIDTWIRYGTASDPLQPYVYSGTTALNTRAAIGATTRTVPANLTPGGTYYYRASADDWGWSAERSMTLTMPTVVTAGATQAGPNMTLYGNVTNAGVASSYYYYFEYGTTPALGSTTPTTAFKSGTGLFSATVTAPTTDLTLYYRAVVRVAAVTTTGSTTSTSVPSSLGANMLKTLLRVVLAGAIMAGILILGLGSMTKLLVSSTIGVIAFVIVDQLISLL